MSKVVREDGDGLTAVLTVTVEKEDYEPKFKTQLNKYRQQAHMKGFRKGKTPMSVVRKLYGKSILSEVVNDLLQQELVRYLTEEKIEILGQPLPSDDQKNIDFDLKNLEDFIFKFDVGLAPDFEVRGVDETARFEKYDVVIADEMIDKELDQARQRFGTREVSEEEIREGDLLKLEARELEGDEVKEGGVESTFSLLIDSVDNDEARKMLLESKVGDTLRLDLFDLEANTDDAYVRKHFLKLDDEEEADVEVGREFEVTVQEASRIRPAELDQEFFDKFFGEEEEVKSEEEAREKVKDSIRKYFDNQAGALLFRDVQETLLKENELELPDEFLRRWLQFNNEGVSGEDIAKEYDNFAKNLQWTLIRGKLTKELGVSVSSDEVLEHFKNQIRGYFGGMSGNDELIDSMARRFMEDEKQVDTTYQNLLTDKLAEAIEAKVTIVPNPVSAEDFEEIIRKAQEEINKADEEEE